mmetsp:Transcript_14769/g.41151  ORF Transcript_14769/g.41151 Transcript_14769/m.41151 type:complete len:103 (+) Transcript_14769:298-606(+)
MSSESLPLGKRSTESAAASTPTTATRCRRQRTPTNTNTDALCHNGSNLSKWMYRFNLWTGLYMLNPYERFVFHLVGWFSFTVSLLYIYVFWKGFVEGFRHSV